MIKALNVTKKFGDLTVVNNLSLSVQPGEIFGFLGLNGAGKTTTLRMLSGIIPPTSGEISIGNFDIVSQPREAKQITGFIPDRPHLYPKLTGLEMILFCAELYGIPYKVACERAEKLLHKFGLSAWSNQLTETYSHGMKQRLATASALVHEPKVLIVDEPMVGLDPFGAKELKKLFRELAASGTTIMLSTHSLNVAEELADRIAIIKTGNVIATGTLAELRSGTGQAKASLEELFLNLTEADGVTHMQDS
jgi:ABC-2 type transport system ATP-binding protein